MKTLLLLLLLPAILLTFAGQASADDPPGSAPEGPVKVRWEGVAAELLRGEEPTEPYAATFPNVRPEDLRWQLYAGEIGSKSNQVYETSRRLWSPTWSTDGLRVGVHYNTYPPFQEDGPDAAAGLLGFDSANVTGVPSDLAYGLLRTSAFDALPGGAKVLMSARSKIALDPREPSPPLLLVDAERMTAFALEGLHGRALPTGGGWSPDGAYVLLFVSSAPAFYVSSAAAVNVPGAASQLATIYSVSMADGSARVVMTQPTGSRQWTTPVWSSAAPYRAVFTLDGALWVFDPHSGSRRLTPDGMFREVDRPSWHEGQRVWIGNKMIDVTTGKMTTYELGQYAATAAVSPDGRYAVTFDFPRSYVYGFPQLYEDRDERQCPATKLPQNRVGLFDLTTGAVSPLKDCDGRSFTRFQWMGDSRHVVMSGGDIYCCHGSNYRVVLKDVITGAETPLTRGFEASAWSVISPDGKKVIVMGDKLRVYTSDGELLQETEPPVGLSVTSASWAPDSERFWFVAGPAGISGL